MNEHENENVSEDDCAMYDDGDDDDGEAAADDKQGGAVGDVNVHEAVYEYVHVNTFVHQVNQEYYRCPVE